MEDISLATHNETEEEIELQGDEVIDELPHYKFEFIAKQHAALSECRDKIFDQPYPQDGQVYCNRTFDGWGCWNDTLAGSRAFIPCPTWANEGFDAKLTAFKDCNADGEWWVHPETGNPWSNYTTCINSEYLSRQQTINQIYLVGYSISLFFLLISLFIFCYFRQLRSTRVSIHKQLFVSFIVHNIVWIIHDTAITPNTDVVKENSWACRLFHVFIRYVLVCNYFWMFCEGLYLHTVLVVAFVKTELLMKIFYAIGWGLPIIPAVSYGIVRALDAQENQKCWINPGTYVYILAAPVIISLLANLIFLCNIVRVLITKMRATNSREDHHTRKAVKATLILVPLLGLQYILFPFRPEEASAGADVTFAYDIASAVFTSLQGLFVSLIFCFFNGEVIDLTRRDLRTRRESYVLNRTRSSMVNNSSIRSKHRNGTGNNSASPSPDLRRPSQFYVHQDSVRCKTPSPNSKLRRPGVFQWQDSSGSLTSGLGVKLTNNGSPGGSSFRRLSNLPECVPLNPDQETTSEVLVPVKEETSVVAL